VVVGHMDEDWGVEVDGVEYYVCCAMMVAAEGK